jgi:hypothetical protein
MSLTPVSDPSGLLERAPRLVELLPDAGLTDALSRGDTWAVYAELERRLAREPRGPTRGLVAALLEDPAAFVIAARPPPTASVLGTGTRWRGQPEAPGVPYVAARTVTVLGLPVWPLDAWLVRASGPAPLQVIGQVPTPRRVRRHRARTGVAALLGLCALLGAGLAWHEASRMRTVTIVNGLSRPVEVRIGGQRWVVPSGGRESGRVKVEDPGLRAVTGWPGEEKPFEEPLLPTWTGEEILYNVHGVSTVRVLPESGATFGRGARSLSDTVNVLREGEQLSFISASWEATSRAHAEAGRWPQAGQVALAVAEVERDNVRAREMAARAFLIAAYQAPANMPDALRWRDTQEFARKLMQGWQEDPDAQSLAQALMGLANQGAFARARYVEHAKTHGDSPLAALYLLRMDTPHFGDTWVVDAYQALTERFPDSPDVVRASLDARWRYEQGEPSGKHRDLNEETREAFARETARLTDAFLEKHPPETVAQLELFVRIYLRARLRDAATSLVRRHAQEPRHRTWDFLVLAGRTAAAAGPEHTSYVMRDWIPSPLLQQPERMALLDLLTGQRKPKQEELAGGPDPVERAALRLTYDVLYDPPRALRNALSESEAVLSRLDPEVSALLALELARTGEARAWQLLNASLPTLLARDSLRGYLFRSSRTGEPELTALHPGLRAAAALVHARRDAKEGYPVFIEALDGLARVDALGGLSVRAASLWMRQAFDACLDTKVAVPLPAGIHLTGAVVAEHARQENDRDAHRPNCEARVVAPTRLPLPPAPKANGAGP